MPSCCQRCSNDGPVDYERYLRQLRAGCACGRRTGRAAAAQAYAEPRGARDASFQTYLDRVASVYAGRGRLPAAAAANCCTTVAPFTYDGGWYTQAKAASWARDYSAAPPCASCSPAAHPSRK